MSLSDDITFVCTSCNRFDLLSISITSFLENSPKLYKYIIIDNGGADKNDILNLFPESYNVSVIINDVNIGQVSSLDKSYSMVRTKYIFSSEEDWEFFAPGFMSKSVKLLEWDDKILNINIRKRYDGTKGSEHPIYGPFNHKTPLDLDYFKYYKFMYNIGPYHGFSWNPGLRRKKEYDLIGSFKQHINEEGMNQFYIKHEFVAACLDTEHCRHIGEGRETPLRNE